MVLKWTQACVEAWWRCGGQFNPTTNSLKGLGGCFLFYAWLNNHAYCCWPDQTYKILGNRRQRYAKNTSFFLMDLNSKYIFIYIMPICQTCLLHKTTALSLVGSGSCPKLENLGAFNFHFYQEKGILSWGIFMEFLISRVIWTHKSVAYISQNSNPQSQTCYGDGWGGSYHQATSSNN